MSSVYDEDDYDEDDFEDDKPDDNKTDIYLAIAQKNCSTHTMKDELAKNIDSLFIYASSVHMENYLSNELILALRISEKVDTATVTIYHVILPLSFSYLGFLVEEDYIKITSLMRNVKLPNQSEKINIRLRKEYYDSLFVSLLNSRDGSSVYSYGIFGTPEEIKEEKQKLFEKGKQRALDFYISYEDYEKASVIRDYNYNDCVI